MVVYMKLTSIHLRPLRATRAPQQAKKLREMFQADRECERAHPEQSRRYNRPLVHSARNVARVALADGLHAFAIMYDSDAIGMATVIPNVVLRSEATVVRGAELDYWLTPRLNHDQVHRTVARDVLAEGRSIAKANNFYLDSSLSMVERADRVSRAEPPSAPNACVFAFIGDPATAANRGLAGVLQQFPDQSRFNVDGVDRFEIGPTMAGASLYTGRLVGADLRAV